MDIITFANAFISLRGKWKCHRRYRYLDAVFYEGSLYIANKKHICTGISPECNKAWMLAAKGIDEEKNAEQIKKFLSEHEELIKKLLSEHEALMDERITSYEEETAKNLSKHKEEVEKRLSEHEQETENHISEYEKKIEKQLAEHETQLDERISEQKEQTEKLISDHAELPLESGAHSFPQGEEGQYLTLKENKLTWVTNDTRTPITKSTTFYVRTDGDDANDGSEDTPEKAFKTINYALNYVADSYNLGNHNVTIYVAAGLYEEAVVLPKYTSTSGSISIVGENKQTTRISVKDNNSITSISSAGLFSIKGLGLDVINTNSKETLYISWLTVSSGVTVNISDIDCTYIAKADTKSSFYGLNCSSGGILNVRNGMTATITRQGDKGYQSFLTALGVINRNGASQDDTMYLSGECTQVIYVKGGYFYRNTAYGEALFSGNVIGRKYNIVNGGRVDTSRAGAEYFPGSTAGIVESSTYSWYK